MGQRIVFYCDVHEIKGEDAVADPDLPILGFDGRWYKFFWCPECFAEKPFSVAELLAMIQEHGVELKPEDVKPAKKSPKATQPALPNTGTEEEQCLWCVYKGPSVSAIHQHVKQIHGFKGFKEAFGTVCPMCNQESGIMGQHAKDHGVTSVATLFQLADKSGDPHGVVAKRRKALAA